MRLDKLQVRVEWVSKLDRGYIFIRVTSYIEQLGPPPLLPNLTFMLS